MDPRTATVDAPSDDDAADKDLMAVPSGQATMAQPPIVMCEVKNWELSTSPPGTGAIVRITGGDPHVLSSAIRELANLATKRLMHEGEDLDALEKACRDVLIVARKDSLVCDLVACLCRLNLAVVLQFRAGRRYSDEAAVLAREAFQGMLQVRDAGSAFRLQALEGLLWILGHSRRADPSETIELTRLLFAEAQRMLDYPRLTAALLLSAAHSARQDRFAEASENAARAADFAMRSLGSSHPLAVRTSLYRAGFAAQSGELQLALDIISTTLSKPAPPHDGSCVLYAMQLEALIMAAMGEPKQALAILSQVLARRFELQGAGNMDVAEASMELGRCLRMCGRATEGCVPIRSALKSQRESLGLTHPSTLRTSLELLACLSWSADPTDLEEAASIGVRVVHAEECSLGCSGPRARVDMYLRLALLALVQHNRLGARSWVTRAERTCEDCAAEVGHEATLASREWATILDVEAAERVSEELQLRLQRCYESRRIAFGEHRPGTLLVAAHLCACLVLQGRLSEAEQLVWSTAYELPAKFGYV